MSKLWAVLFYLCLALSPAAYAGLSPTALVLESLFHLKELGATHVGDIPLQTLLEDLVQVQVLETPSPLVADSFRSGAVNFVESKSVVLFAPFIHQNSLTENRLLLTHEFLEAAGYDDQHYQISTMIRSLGAGITPKEKNLRVFGFYKSPRKLTKNRKYELTLAGGGTITGVGSGGDPKAGLAKIVFAQLLLSDLTELEEKTGKDLSSLKNEILSLEFEPTTEQTTYGFKIQPYENGKGRKKSGFKVLISSGYSPYHAYSIVLLEKEVWKALNVDYKELFRELRP